MTPGRQIATKHRVRAGRYTIWCGDREFEVRRLNQPLVWVAIEKGRGGWGWCPARPTLALAVQAIEELCQ